MPVQSFGFNRTLLCKSCRTWFESFQEFPDAAQQKPGIILHQNVSQFVAAVQGGCLFCCYLRDSMFKAASEDNLLQASKSAVTSEFLYLSWSPNGNRGEPQEKVAIDLSVRMTAPDGLVDIPLPFAMLVLLPQASITRPRPLSSTFNWDESLDLAAKHLAECTGYHKICRERQQNYVPTRLLYVGTTSQPTLRLVLTGSWKPSPVVRYVSLSHCWGNYVPMTLLSSNLAAMERSIDEQSLSKTFREAIKVTRRFELEYIWIDSLCIIQDSKIDWQKESMKMADVYGSAYFSIDATAAKDGSVGLFRETRVAVNPDIVVDVAASRGVTFPYVICDYRYANHFLLDQPLLKRAWVLQERFLSPRIIHFTSTQIFWECREQVACENYPGGLPAVLWPTLKHTCRTDVHGNKREKSGRKRWQDIVESYSACGLTFAADKLIAMAGMAKRFQEDVFKCEYLAGLWTSSLVHDMTWEASKVAGQDVVFSRPAEYRAPSWSWASIDGIVNFGPDIPPGTALIDINCYRVEPVTIDSFSQVKRAWIEAEGMITRLDIQVSKEELLVGRFPRAPTVDEFSAELQHLMHAETNGNFPEHISDELVEKMLNYYTRIEISLDTTEKTRRCRQAAEMGTCTVLCVPLVYHEMGIFKALLIEPAGEASELTFTRIGSVLQVLPDPENSAEELTHKVYNRFFFGQMIYQQNHLDDFGRMRFVLV